MGSLNKIDKLRTQKEFLYTYQNAKKWYCEGVVIFYLSTLENKVGFTASKKVGKAVDRNRAKRRMRAIFVEIQSKIKAGVYIFVARSSLNELQYSKVKKNILWGLKKLECLE